MRKSKEDTIKTKLYLSESFKKRENELKKWYADKDWPHRRCGPFGLMVRRTIEINAALSREYWREASGVIYGN